MGYTGLYIHIPFCVRKCAYCDFTSYAGRESLFEPYIGALERELGSYGAGVAAGAAADTVFIGGGTPSVLSAELISRLCKSVRTNFELAERTEWSMEVNPGTVTEEKLNAMLEGGINRVSVGVQSFCDAELRAAGRIHSAQEAYDTVLGLRAAGFENISIDLMASLPLQTAESFKKTLGTAAELPVRHISVYSLIIEDGTPLKEKYDSGEYPEPDEDEDRELYRYTGEFLAGRGFERYEISNYAAPGYESRHNIKYWECTPYIGAGAAAHSYTGSERYFNTPSLEEYISGGGRRMGLERLSENDRMSEFMMMGLRMTAGVSYAEFVRRFGRDLRSVYARELERLVPTGLLEERGGRLRLTPRGLDVANPVMCEFML